MVITLDVDRSGQVSTRIQAITDLEASDPLPLIKTAIEELQWHYDNYERCPYHGTSD